MYKISYIIGKILASHEDKRDLRPTWLYHYHGIESGHVIRASHLTEHESNIYNICHPFFYFLFLDESIFAERIDFEAALLHEGLQGLESE